MASNEEGSSPWSKTVTYCTLPDKLSCPGKPVPKGRIHASCFRVTWGKIICFHLVSDRPTISVDFYCIEFCCICSL